MIANIFKKYFGPSTLVTAAFIGPGTLTVCTISGATQGYSLIWVLIFATVTTIILQEMAARLGLITQKGLGEAIRLNIESKVLKSMSIALVFTAIIVGNAAYEAGNISGATLGLSGVLGESIIWPIAIGITAFALLLLGKSKILEYILIGLVILMSFVFIITAVLVKPDIAQIFRGLLPSITNSNQLSILALIGTTVVPYNLFLHASSVQKKWNNSDQLPGLRVENSIAVGLGGLISIAILITSAGTIYGSSISGMSEMSKQLDPLLGGWSNYFLATGLFAAGISSSITAPLAAAYTAKGIFGWNTGLKDVRFRAVWFSILITGVLFSISGFKPISVIQIAQIANGILLPVMVFFLIYLCNKKDLLGKYINKPWQNVLGVFVMLMSLVISLRSLNSVFGFL